MNLDGALRIKDARGRYWCPECEARYQTAQSQGTVARCPACGITCALADMARAREQYVCVACAQQIEAAASAAGGSARRLPKLLTLLASLFLVMSYLWYDVFWG